MALVLRKAVLPRNITLLKCIKGRNLASATNRTNVTASSKAVPRSQRVKKMTKGIVKIAKVEQLAIAGVHGGIKTIHIRYCLSCPSLFSEMPKPDFDPSQTHKYSLLKTRPLPKKLGQPKAVAGRTSFSTFYPKISSLLQASDVSQISKRGYAGKPCPPPSPCCLPPPCNTPAKCVQYMTGYYYYPYGFWFCGPYHVTGLCSPCSQGKAAVPCACACAKCCACLSPAIATAFNQQPKTQDIKQKFGHPCPPVARQPPVQQTASKESSPPSVPLTFPSCYQIKQTKVEPAQVPPAPPQKSQETRSTSEKASSKTPLRTGISKFFPFRSGPSEHSGKTSSLFCPYSTQPPTISVAESLKQNLPIDSFPKQNLPIDNCPKQPIQPKAFMSGSFSKSFSDYFERKANQKLNFSAAKETSGDNDSPTLESPRRMMSPEERDRPRFKPDVFRYSDIPNFKKPYPST